MSAVHLSPPRDHAGTRKKFSREGHGLGYMGSADRKPITGDWGKATSEVQSP